MSRRSGPRKSPSPPPPPAVRRSLWPFAAGAALLAFGSLGVWLWSRGPAFELIPNADQNVLFVTVDTLRADALGSYGGPVPTPNIDALAAHGARFTFAHSHAVVTLVSHTTMLTGRYPYEHGVRDNSGYRVPAGTVTAATRMKAIGFSTGAFIGGFPLVKRFGLSPDFDEYDDQIGEMQGAIDFSLPERRADVVVSRAVKWIDAQHSKFFAWVHVYDPHGPYKPPADWLSKYPSQPYYAEVAWTDFALGPLFQKLSTLSKPTLVILTGDHGEGLGEHGEMTHGMFAYETTLHIPLIVSQIVPRAAQAPRGTVIDAPVRHVDILPTILDAVTAPADPSLPGASLRDVIHGGGRGDRPEYFEAMTGNVARDWAPLRGVLVGREKYIDLPIPERYDLSTDASEQRNLAEADVSRTQIMLNTLRTYNVSPPKHPVQETAAVAEQLRALGYISSGPQPDKQVFTEDDDPKRLIAMDHALHEATDAYENGRRDEAIERFKAVLKERPGTADTYKYLAFVYWQNGQPGLAISTLESALERGLHDQVAVRLGIYLSETGEAAKAVAILKTMPGDDVDALNALGIAYGQMGRDADAIAEFNRVLTIEPSNGYAYQNTAVVQLRLGRVADAEQSLKKAIDADPALASAFTTLGVVFSKTGREANAIDAWKQAVELDATEYMALYNLTVELASTGRMEEARAYGGRFVSTAPPAFYQSDIAAVRKLIGS